MTTSVVTAALRAGKPEADTFAGFLGRAHVAGVARGLAAFYAGTGAHQVASADVRVPAGAVLDLRGGRRG